MTKELEALALAQVKQLVKTAKPVTTDLNLSEFGKFTTLEIEIEQGPLAVDLQVEIEVEYEHSPASYDTPSDLRADVIGYDFDNVIIVSDTGKVDTQIIYYGGNLPDSIKAELIKLLDFNFSI
jgi:hypothetical protein